MVLKCLSLPTWPHMRKPNRRADTSYILQEQLIVLLTAGRGTGADLSVIRLLWSFLFQLLMIIFKYSMENFVTSFCKFWAFLERIDDAVSQGSIFIFSKNWRNCLFNRNFSTWISKYKKAGSNTVFFNRWNANRKIEKSKVLHATNTFRLI
jgi:hypothetical protein